MAGDPLYLSEERLKATGLTYEDALAELREAFARRAKSADPVISKIGLYTDDGFFHAMPGVLDDIAVVKWVASTKFSTEAGKHINAQLIATHAKTAETLAFMDFSWATGLRTAAVSALGADYWAAPDADTIAMVGCGLQARTHLDALLAVRPIKRIIALSRTEQSARKYADEVAARGLEVVVVNDRPDQVYEADIVISMVPLSTTASPFLDAGRLKPGALAIGVDLGKAWKLETLDRVDHLTTDDLTHTEGLVESGMVKVKRPFESDLAQAVSGQSSVDWSKDKCIFYLPPGMALADAAIARAFLRKMGSLPPSA